MTRARAIHETYMPTPIMEHYYEQRAGAGLIISEGIVVSKMANGNINIPGIYNEEQTAVWKKITQKVHAKGGKIFAQLWHVGRISHPSVLNGKLPLAPSAINPHAFAYTFEGKQETVTPKEMTVEEIKEIVTDFKNAAKNAMTAGFDGVEIHAANGYLFQQFLSTSANHRADAYGGSVENRSRFLLETVDAISSVTERERLGIRLNPEMDKTSGIDIDDETRQTYVYLAGVLNKKELAYLHLTGTGSALEGKDAAQRMMDIGRKFREKFKGNIILNHGFDKETGQKAIDKGVADLISYGILYLTNPDLEIRFKHDLPLNEFRPGLNYENKAEGYTDYPFYKFDKTKASTV